MRTLAFIFGVLLSFVTWAQMPDRGTWMAGGDDGGSGLPGGGWDWYILGFVCAMVVISFIIPRKYAEGMWGLFWLSPLLLWGGIWAWTTFLR